MSNKLNAKQLNALNRWAKMGITRLSENDITTLENMGNDYETMHMDAQRALDVLVPNPHFTNHLGL